MERTPDEGETREHLYRQVERFDGRKWKYQGANPLHPELDALVRMLQRCDVDWLPKIREAVARTIAAEMRSKVAALQLLGWDTADAEAFENEIIETLTQGQSNERTVDAGVGGTCEASARD